MTEQLTGRKIQDPMQKRAWRLGLYGLCSNWGQAQDNLTVDRIVQWEEQERQRRSLDRRVRDSLIGRFKPIADFDGPGRAASTARPSRTG